MNNDDYEIRKHMSYEEQMKQFGSYKRWYSNKLPNMQHFFKNGKLHGELMEWWLNGQFVAHCFYKCDERHGEYKRWFENGQRYEHSLYEHGKKIISFYCYHVNIKCDCSCRS